MADIYNLLEQISSAIYGEDVRGSIHDAIEQCYEDATGNPDSLAAIFEKLFNGQVGGIGDISPGTEYYTDVTLPSETFVLSNTLYLKPGTWIMIYNSLFKPNDSETSSSFKGYAQVRRLDGVYARVVEESRSQVILSNSLNSTINGIFVVTIDSDDDTLITDSDPDKNGTKRFDLYIRHSGTLDATAGSSFAAVKLKSDSDDEENPGLANQVAQNTADISLLNNASLELDDDGRLKISGLSSNTPEVNDRIEIVEQGLSTEISTRKSSDSDLSNQIAVERSRINGIIALPDGSTTADAELVDIRTGYDLHEYESAGDAVRFQIRDVKSDLAEITTESPNLLNFNSDWSLANDHGIDFSADKNSCVISMDGTASSAFARSISFGGYLQSLGLTVGEEVTMSVKVVGDLTGTIYASLANQSATSIKLTATAKEGHKTFSYTSAMSTYQMYFNNATAVDAEIHIQIERGNTPTEIHPKGYLFAFDEKARNDIQVLDSRCDSVDTLLTNNARFMPKGYLFQFGITGWQPTECCWVNDELYVFEYSSNDDHTVYSNVYVYHVDFINKTLVLDRTLTNNLGHCNTVSYDSFRDYFILGNGGNSSNTEPNEIYLIANAKSKTVLDVDDSDTIRIDVSQLGWGKQLNVCWGDSNRGSRNIAYAMTNYEAGNMDSYYVNNIGSFTGESKRYIRQLFLGFGENHLTYGNYISGRNYNQFNGTFEILKVYERPFVYHEANNGTSFYAGKLYENTVYATNGIHICKHTFSDFGESIETDKILIPLYKADGTPYGAEFEGLDIRKDGLLCSPVSGWIRLYVI